MGFHLQCDDGLGRCMAIFVYLIMFIGNGTFFLTVVWKSLDTEDEMSRLIEYGCYSACWFLMFLSHVMTMCVDPGFIPRNYNAYKQEVLAAPFPTLDAIESAHLKRDTEALGIEKSR